MISMTDQIFYKLKRSVYYLGSKDQAALFYFFGKKIIIKGPFVHSGFNQLIRVLQNGIAHSALTTQLVDMKIDPAILPIITREFAQKGLLTITKSLRELEVTPERHKKTVTTELSDYVLDTRLQRGSPKDVLFLSLLGEHNFLTTEHNFKRENEGKNTDGELIKTWFYKCDPENPLVACTAWPNANLYVVLSNGFQSSAIHKLNMYFYENEKPWLLATADGCGGSIGPYFAARSMPCYNCYTSRRLANETDLDTQILLENYFSRVDSEIIIPKVILAPILELIRLEVYKILFMPATAQSIRGLTDFDLINFLTKHHVLLPVPSCQVCSPLMRENMSDQNYKHCQGYSRNV